jgi:hypothetical protein
MVGGGKGETNAYGRPVGVVRGGIAAKRSRASKISTIDASSIIIASYGRVFFSLKTKLLAIGSNFKSR